MKTKYLYILLLAILSIAMFSSCDSLWQVQEGKNSISFELSVSDLMHSINSENTFFSETQARNNSVIQTLEVSLLDSDTNEELAPSQKVVVTSVNERISVEFPNLSHVGKSFYVKIAVTLQNAEIITIESKKQIMKSGINPVTFTKYDIATDITIVLSDASKTAFDVVVNPDDEDSVTSRTVIVYDASNNDIIAVKMLSEVELVKDVEIVFSGIPIGTEVYAVLEVLGDELFSANGYSVYLEPTVFRARTENAIIGTDSSNLIAHPNAIFLSSDSSAGGVTPGNDSFTGVTPLTPVATWSVALEKLKVNDTLLPDATIYVKEPIKPVGGETLIDGEGVILKKYSSGDLNLIEVDDSLTREIVLTNITLDGNKSLAGYTEFSGYTVPDSALININETSSGTTLTLSHNTVITNSRGGGVSLAAGKLSLEGNPIVTGNYIRTPADPIGVAQNIYIGSREVELTVTNLNNANVGIATDLAVDSTVFASNGVYPDDLLTFIKPDGDYGFTIVDTSVKLIPAYKDGAYRLGSQKALEWFRDYVNAGNANADAVLTADITLSDGHWKAIGNDSGDNSLTYSGTFDGQGYSIKNLTFDSYNNSSVDGEGKYNGLFGTVSGGTIKNVMVSEVDIKDIEANSGVVVGNAKDNTRIINVATDGYYTIDGVVKEIGGIVGTLDNSSITSCYNGVIANNVMVSFKVVANKNNTTTITECYYYDGNTNYYQQTNDEDSANVDPNTVETIVSGMNSSNGSENYEWYLDGIVIKLLQR